MNARYQFLRMQKTIPDNFFYKKNYIYQIMCVGINRHTGVNTV